MLLKRNIFEYLTIISCCGSFICIILNYVTNISPITGIWFPLYILCLFVMSVLFSIKFIQWLLKLNKPIKYDLDGLVKNYPQLSFLNRLLPQTKKRAKRAVEEYKEYDTNELSVITTVLEKKLVSSWYVPYISQEIGFPFACKQMLDQMISKTFQICSKIETKDVYVDICSIFVTHLKEYKKTMNRHEKSPTTNIDTLYKKVHPMWNNKKSPTAEHCTNILRVVLKELVPWELWDTPHSELLVRVLSKKLDTFIDVTLADPKWLNDKLMAALNKTSKESFKHVEKEEKKEAKKEENEKTKETKKETEKEVIKPEITTVESALSTLITKSTAPILQRAINVDTKENQLKDKTEDIVKEMEIKGSEPVDIKSSPILRQRRGRQGKNEVKIYDRIVEGSVKTWETDVDLQCISLGQDLLASLDGEITLSRLWGQDTETDADGSPNPPRSTDSQPLWFGEEDAVDIVDITDRSSPKERSPIKKEQHSPKPTELLKDLQSTVHQAKTKIGDLQVPLHVDVPKTGDEAAGMMEGLLDFGITNLKKGLRFTGLSDDSQDKADKLPSHHKEKSGDKMSPPEMKPRTIATEPKEIITSNVIQKEDIGNTVAPPLVKQHRVTSQDSTPWQGRAVVAPAAGGESPEPEYEEAADLSTSIAKLRSLLQQRADSAATSLNTAFRNEDIWWEGAEETRGRTQSYHSSRPVDTAALADEYDMTADRTSPPGQASIHMQRLDKLFQRTVTGVFNSLRTAVAAGAEAEGEGLPSARAPPDWTYVCTSIELSVGGAVARLVGSRRAFTHVDAALDSLDHLPPPPPRAVGVLADDFDEWCWRRGVAWAGGAECAAAAGLARAHLPLRLAALALADLAESLINIWLDDFTAWLKKQVFLVFEQMSKDTPDVYNKDKTLREFNIDETCDAIMEQIPDLYVFSEETMSNAVRLTVSSFSHKELNKDVIFRVLDILVLHFKKSASVRNPSFDVN